MITQKSKVKGAFSFYCLLLIAYCLLSSVVFAGEKTITLTDAWQSAISTYETLMLSQEDVYQSEKGIDKAISQILPTLTADANYTKYSESKKNLQPDNSTSYDIKLSQSLYSGGKEWSLWRQAKKKTESSKHSLEATREGIMLNVSQAYYLVLKAEKIVDIKEASLRRVKEQRRVATTRFQVGEVTKAIVLRAEADAAGAEAELANAKKDLLVAKDKLARLIVVSEEFKVVDPNIQAIPDANLDKFISLSLEKRQDYIQSKLDEEVADEGITYAWGNFLPSLKLEGVYSKREQDTKTAFFNDESMYAGITFTYPLFEGGLRKAEIDEAKSKKRQAEFKKMGKRKDIELEVREAFHNLEAFGSVIESNKRQVSFAEENYTMVFKQFTYGLSTNVDVIDANTILVSSQSNLINATYDFQMAILELKKKVGILLEDMMPTMK
ncbi:MAG: TolC family protein [Deltaproteobacteria bacterium]|nr:TolC family protein [Deltaproteobacteria bacterium]